MSGNASPKCLTQLASAEPYRTNVSLHLLLNSHPIKPPTRKHTTFRPPMSWQGSRAPAAAREHGWLSRLLIGTGIISESKSDANKPQHSAWHLRVLVPKPVCAQALAGPGDPSAARLTLPLRDAVCSCCSLGKSQLPGHQPGSAHHFSFVFVEKIAKIYLLLKKQKQKARKFTLAVNSVLKDFAETSVLPSTK